MGMTLSKDGAYAKAHGVTKRKVKSLGGADRLESLSPDARAILLGRTFYGNSATIRLGGLAKRGMGQRGKSRT